MSEIALDREAEEQCFMEAVASCDEALAIDPCCIKAKFRKAIALERRGDLDMAFIEVTSALELAPDHADLQKLAERLGTSCVGGIASSCP